MLVASRPHLGPLPSRHFWLSSIRSPAVRSPVPGAEEDWLVLTGFRAWGVGFRVQGLRLGEGDFINDQGVLLRQLKTGSYDLNCLIVACI